MKKSLLSIVILVSFFYLNAQQSTAFTFPLLKSVDVHHLQKDWSAFVYSIEAPYPGSDSYRNYIHQLKQLRNDMANNEEVITNTNSFSSKSIVNPQIDTAFQANYFGGIPNDNDIAVSNEGNVVSVSNSDVFIYDDQGQLLLNYRLEDLADSLGLVANSYDPKVIYDQNEDRFILVFLNGNSSASTNIIVGFSKSNDPTQGFHLYALDGNPFNNNAWSDFPMIAINNQDFFVTVNHINSDSVSWQTGFMQSVIWQVQKEEGYNGQNINAVVHGDINFNNKPIRNLLPVQAGLTLKDHQLFFISNRNFDLQNDTFFIVRIDESLSQNANPIVQVDYGIASQNYGLPPDAQQTATTFLQTNDARPLSGLVENGFIHFVGNTIDFSNNKVAIYHGRFNILQNSPNIDLTIIGDSNLEFGYPNLSYAGLTTNDEKILISFNHTSIDSFPGMSAIYYNKIEGYSDRLHIVSGTSNVDVINGNFQRWGDYSGNQRRYNTQGEFWLSGFMGFRNNLALNKDQHKTYVAKIMIDDDTPTNIQQQKDVNLSVYPNPFDNQFTIEFYHQEAKPIDVKLVDLSGKLVLDLGRYYPKSGANSFVCRFPNLASGIYYLQAYNQQNETVFTHQIINK